MTTEELKKLRSGDTEAFEKLVEDNRENVYRLVLSVVKNNEDAEDVSQEVFIKVYTSLPSFSGSSSVSTWIYRIAYNSAVDFVRKGNRKVETRSVDDTENNFSATLIAPSCDEPEKRFEVSEKRKDIYEALSELPYDQRRIIELRDIHGFSYEEISDITGQREGTVKSRLNRGRAALKKKLSEKWNI